MKKMNCLSIFIAATLLTGTLALISILGTQSAMADDNNSHNKLKYIREQTRRTIVN